MHCAPIVRSGKITFLIFLASKCYENIVYFAFRHTILVLAGLKVYVTLIKYHFRLIQDARLLIIKRWQYRIENHKI